MVLGNDTDVKQAGTTPVIILIEPQLGENIGTAARAMANFGLNELRIVNPRDGWPNEDALSAAAGAHHVVEDAVIFATIEEAISDINYLYATTARKRDLAKPVLTPNSLAQELKIRLEADMRCGILFGRERSGLKNDEIALADAMIMAPVNPEYASLNLAQAVLLIGYEWMQALGTGTLGRETEFEGPSQEGLNLRASRPATKDELVGFFGHLEQELDKSGFLRPPEKRPIMVRNIRSLFSRLAATEQEVRTLRGIVSSLTRSHRNNNGR